jgi:heat shock protein HslJ
LVAELEPRTVKTDENGSSFPTDQLRLEDRKWILASLNGSAIPKVEQEAFLVFDPAKGSAGGDTSCNAYGGSYKVNGNKISITQIISTMRACIEDERMNIERGFLDGLRSADRYEIKADELMLYRRNKLMLTFVGRRK